MAISRTIAWTECIFCCRLSKSVLPIVVYGCMHRDVRIGGKGVQRKVKLCLYYFSWFSNVLSFSVKTVQFTIDFFLLKRGKFRGKEVSSQNLTYLLLNQVQYCYFSNTSLFFCSDPAIALWQAGRECLCAKQREVFWSPFKLAFPLHWLGLRKLICLD